MNLGMPASWSWILIIASTWPSVRFACGKKGKFGHDMSNISHEIWCDKSAFIKLKLYECEIILDIRIMIVDADKTYIYTIKIYWVQCILA